MQAEQNYKKEYEEYLTIYSKKKTETTNLSKNITNTQSIIARLILQLALGNPEPISSQPHQDRTELDNLTLQLQQLDRLVQQHQLQIDRDGKRDSQQNLMAQGASNNNDSSNRQSFDVSELDKLTKELEQTQRAIKQQEMLAQIAHQQIKQFQGKVAILSNQIELLKNVENIEGQIIDSNSSLEQELTKLQSQYDSIEGQVKKSQQQHKNQRSSKQQLVKNEKNMLVRLEKEKNELIAKQNSLQHNKSSNQSQKVNQLQSDIKQLQSKNVQLQREVESLTQLIETKKTEKAARQQQLKKYKQKKERNYKLQIVEAEKTHQNLNKEMDREKQKLAGVIKLSKSYVSQQNLQILQKQLGRHQAISSKFNLQSEQAKKNKFIRQNQILKARIQYLKQSSKKLEQQTQQVLRELKKGSDELVKQKLAQQKLLNQTTNKLNEYMKEFPDHEKKKEMQKQEEKRKKQEQKEKLRQALRKEKEKKKQQEDDKVRNKEQPLLNNTIIKQVHLPTQDQQSIFNNRQFQITCGVIAILLILLLFSF